MSQFKRKGEGADFEASEAGPSSMAGRSGPGEPDFSALEPASGFSAGEVGREADTSPVQPTPGSRPASPERDAGDIFGPISEGPGRQAETPARPAAPTRKKRYYSPGEVMQRRGCIGCGGMILAMASALAVIGLAIVLL